MGGTMIRRIYKWLTTRQCGEYRRHCDHSIHVKRQPDPDSSCRAPVDMILYRCCRCNRERYLPYRIYKR